MFLKMFHRHVGKIFTDHHPLLFTNYKIEQGQWSHWFKNDDDDGDDADDDDDDNGDNADDDDEHQWESKAKQGFGQSSVHPDDGEVPVPLIVIFIIVVIMMMIMVMVMIVVMKVLVMIISKDFAPNFMLDYAHF